MTKNVQKRPSQQNKKYIFPRNNSERSNAASQSLNQFFTNVLNKNAFRMLFSLVSQFCYCHVVLPGHLSQHEKAATAEGLTFSDPIHKKSARNLNLYDFCHSPKMTKIVQKRPSQQNKKYIFPRNNSERSNATSQSLNQFFTNVLNKNAFRMLFSLVSQFCYCHVVLPTMYVKQGDCLQHYLCKAT
jgi:hypothetical protein